SGRGRRTRWPDWSSDVCSSDLLRAEQESAEKILAVAEDRESQGFELPVEVTKAQLTKARVVERILQLEEREDQLEVFLRYQLGQIGRASCRAGVYVGVRTWAVG